MRILVVLSIGYFVVLALATACTAKLTSTQIETPTTILASNPCAYQNSNPTPLTILPTINVPSERQVFQKQDNGPTTIQLSGQLPAGATCVEAQVMQGNNILVDFTTLSSPSITSGGTFSGGLSVPVFGGWYQLYVRYVDSAGKLNFFASPSIQKFGIGYLLIIAGQSNASNCPSSRATSDPTNPSIDPTTQYDPNLPITVVPANDLVSAAQYDLSTGLTSWRSVAAGGGTAPLPGTRDSCDDIAGNGTSRGAGGHWGPSLANQMVGLKGRPVGLITVAYGGTSIAQWQKPAEPLTCTLSGNNFNWYCPPADPLIPPSSTDKTSLGQPNVGLVYDSRIPLVSPTKQFQFFSLYQRLRSTVLNAYSSGGGVAAILWYQGETDSGCATNSWQGTNNVVQTSPSCISTSQYATLLNRLINDLNTDLGFQIPWSVGQSGWTPNGNPARIEDIQFALNFVGTTNPAAQVGAEGNDLGWDQTSQRAADNYRDTNFICTGTWNGSCQCPSNTPTCSLKCSGNGPCDSCSDPTASKNKTCVGPWGQNIYHFNSAALNIMADRWFGVLTDVTQCSRLPCLIR
jgi:hypothetical protein